MKKVLIAFLTVFIIMLAIAAVQAYAVPLLPALQVTTEGDGSVPVEITATEDKKDEEPAEPAREEIPEPADEPEEPEGEEIPEPADEPEEPEDEETPEPADEPEEPEDEETPEPTEETEEPEDEETPEPTEETEEPEDEETPEPTEEPTKSEGEETPEPTEEPTKSEGEETPEPTVAPTEPVGEETPEPTEVPTEEVDREVYVTIKGNTLHATYDGERHAVSGYTVTGISNDAYTERDFIFTGKAYVEMIDAGVSYMGLTDHMFINKNNQFDVYFEIEDGYVEVSPINVEVQVIGMTETMEYDGNTHAVDGYIFRQTFPIGLDVFTEDSFEFSGDAYAERSEVGISYMGLNGGSFRNINPNFGRVMFHVTDGYIEITPSEELLDEVEEPTEEPTEIVPDEEVDPTVEPTETVPDEEAEPTEEPTEIVPDEEAEPTEEPTEIVPDEEAEPTEEPTETVPGEEAEPTEEPTETVPDEEAEPTEEPTETVPDEEVEPTEEPTEIVPDEDAKPTEEPTETIPDEEAEPTEEPTETIPDEEAEPTEEPTETVPGEESEPTEEPTETVPGEEAEPKEEPAAQTMVFAAETVIYAADSIESDVIMTLEEETEFVVLSKNDSGWVEIQLGEDASGFVLLNEEETEEPGEDVIEVPETESVSTVVLPAGTVIYSDADVTSEVLMTLEEETEFNVADTELSGWMSVQLTEGEFGFVLTAEPEEETEQGTEKSAEVVTLPTGTVIYAAADETSEVLKILEEDAEFAVVSRDDSGWLSIMLGEEEIGYVLTTEPESVEVVLLTAGTVIYAAADETSEVLNILETDTEFVVANKDESGWLEIKLDEETTGFTAEPAEADEPDVDDGMLKVSAGTNVRAAADGMSEIIYTFAEDGTAKVISREGDWFMVEVTDGPTGYIFAGDVQTDEEKGPSADKKVFIFTSRRIVMPMGAEINLTSLLEGFEEDETILYQWECDKGNGFEPIADANGDSYSYEATIESLTWSFRLIVSTESGSDNNTD